MELKSLYFNLAYVSIYILTDYYKSVFSFLYRGKEKLLKSSSYCAVNQLIMRVNKSNIAYKLTRLYSKNAKGELWLIIIKTQNNKKLNKDQSIETSD